MPPSSEASVPSPQSADPKPEYTPQERAALLRLAHDAILSTVENRELAPFPASPHLSEPRGVFTTVYSEHKLRGCVGYPLPILPLHRAIVETARAAAFDDPRFVPVSLDEAKHLQISISVLSRLQPIRAENVIVGQHGLVISQAGCRGLLLPQVPIEHDWDRITFLEQTCHKAGLPSNAWQKGATIEVFTAEVFGDKGLSV